MTETSWLGTFFCTLLRKLLDLVVLPFYYVCVVFFLVLHNFLDQ